MSEWNPSLESEERGADESDFKQYRDALLFAVEVSPSMLEPTGGTSTVKLVLDHVYRVVADRIQYSPLDATGLILYGVDNKDPESKSPHCLSVLPLGIPGAAALKQLKVLVEDDQELARLCVPVPASKSMKSETNVGGWTLADVLFHASQEFSLRAPRFFSKRLFLITDSDAPHDDDKLRTAAKTRALDLLQIGVVLSPFLVYREGANEPNPDRFYSHLLLSSSEEGPPVHTVRDLDLGESLHKRQVLRRALFRNTLELAPNIKIRVRAYTLVSVQKPARAEWLYTEQERPQILHTVTKHMIKESAEEVSPADIQRVYEFGDAQVPLSPSQVAQIKRFDDPVIRVLGFKDRSAVPAWMSMTTPMFLYPYDSEIKGSIRAFSALYQGLLKKDKVALAWTVVRKGATPRIQCLWPSDGTVFPQGLFMTNLPFADDTRQIPRTFELIQSEDLVQQTEILVKQLFLPAGYEPRRYHNHPLQYFFNLLQALVLDEPVPERSKDSTLPKYKEINTRAGDAIEKWNTVFAGISIARPNDGDDDDVQPPTPAKRTKAVVGTTDADFEAAARANDFRDFQVKHLKEFLERRGLEVQPPPGRRLSRPDYVMAIKDVFR